MDFSGALVWFIGLWGISILVGVVIGYALNQLMSVLAGAISLAIAVLITYLVHALLIQSGDITWALIAVGVAAFFSGMFGYLNGVESTKPS
ncbi:hypothetical protein [Methanonatronarchaeum sp. AMET-Sl]|uniref:hypothetical protein n=1 Tax=Methanonatronarchaeum sp. AMET-Sl TaxID=3037654 RepID=UPI00244E4D7F|nr:hypothetical protein [Methanonatronarchaeum sp. AMET-Sl]WGI18036.1 hypothetical protein QEN48_03265 [Methanonatronarchaeum sp. AMET-Sl]